MEFFQSRHDLIKIAYNIYPVGNPFFKMVFLTGRAEFFQKYEPLFGIFNKNGISVYAMDHRGQGASGRMLEDPHKGHVEKFSYYVDDVSDFVDNIVLKENPEVPVILLSHSMGGTVSLLLAERKKGVFDRIIFSSPMWGINLGKLSHKLAYILAEITVAFGKGKDYLPGKKGYRTDRTFEDNMLTHSIDNFKRQAEMIKNDPSLALGGPTHLWLLESLKTIDDIQKREFDTGSKHLLLQAEKDNVVDNKYQDRVITKLKNSKKYVVKGAWHEILYEEEACFRPALEEILMFLER